MDRRAFLAASALTSLSSFCLSARADAQVFTEASQVSDGKDRRPILVRSGFTRNPDGTEKRAPSPSGMFDTELVRTSDSDGRLAVFLFAPGKHHAYAGAPLHVHHKQDEWIFVMAGEFVAEVGGNRMRLKPGDALLMPMRIPHRWSVAQESHCGAIHLYTPAGLMDAEWSPLAQNADPKNAEARKTEFEKHELTLLGESLTKDEIDGTS